MSPDTPFLKVAAMLFLYTIMSGCCSGIPGGSGPERMEGKKFHPKFVLNYDSLNGGFRVENIDTILLIRYNNTDSVFDAPIDTLSYFYGLLSGHHGTEFGILSGSNKDYVMDYGYLIKGKNLDKEYRIREIKISVTDQSTRCDAVINEKPASYRLNGAEVVYDQYILINKK